MPAHTSTMPTTTRATGEIHRIASACSIGAFAPVPLCPSRAVQNDVFETILHQPLGHGATLGTGFVGAIDNHLCIERYSGHGQPPRLDGALGDEDGGGKMAALVLLLASGIDNDGAGGDSLFGFFKI